MINLNRFRLLLVFIVIISAIVTGGIVYFLQNKQIKSLKERALALQAQIISLEAKIGRDENQTGFLKIDENKYVGEAQVSGKYYLSGAAPDVCFSPDKESLALLPESTTVQIFCFKTQDAKESDELIKTFYGISRLEAIRDFKKYGTIEAARKAKVLIEDYEIRQFSVQSKTGYTRLVKIVEKEQ